MRLIVYPGLIVGLGVALAGLARASDAIDGRDVRIINTRAAAQLDLTASSSQQTATRDTGVVVYDNWMAPPQSAGFSNIYFDDCACYFDPDCAGGNVRFLRMGNVAGGIWPAEATSNGAGGSAPGDIVWDDYVATNWPVSPAQLAPLAELRVTIVVNNNLAGVLPDPDRLYALLVDFVDEAGIEQAAFTATFTIPRDTSGVFQLIIDATLIDPPAMIPASGYVGFDFLNMTFDASTLNELPNSTQGVGIAHGGGDNVLAGCATPAALQNLGTSVGDEWSIASSAIGQLTFNAGLFNTAPRENKRFGAPPRWYSANLPVRISVSADQGCPGPGSCVCDIDGDCRVDLADLAGVLGAFGKSPGDPGYSAQLNCATASASIGLDDLALLLADFGSDCSAP
ncbi:MAG: hypothetical protein KDA32_02340 [Phycisphaerales bacterium]|nr:hypothetical protein [Phycisphaerales bacterium]